MSSGALAGLLLGLLDLVLLDDRVLLLLDLEAAHDLVVGDLDVLLAAELLVDDRRLVLAVEQAEGDALGRLDGRVQRNRDRDQPEGDVSVPDRSRIGRRPQTAAQSGCPQGQPPLSPAWSCGVRAALAAEVLALALHRASVQ